MANRTLGQDSLSAQTISHYRVLEKLGGGMGVVYKAEVWSIARFHTCVALSSAGCRIVSYSVQ